MKQKKAIKEVGSYLRTARVNVLLSQREVGHKFGFTTAQFISNIERGICLPPAQTHKLFVQTYKLKPQEFAEKILNVEKVKIMASIQGAVL